jgi:hypothetical protein
MKKKYIYVELHDCHSYYQDVVTPVVGICRLNFDQHKRRDDIVDFEDRHHPLRVNADEIDQIISVDVDELCDPANIAFDDLGYRAGHVPVFMADTHNIWGLTGIIIRDFLAAIDEWQLETPVAGSRIIRHLK